MPAGLPHQCATCGVRIAVPARKPYTPAAPPPTAAAAASCGAERLAETAASFSAPSAVKSSTAYQSSYASPPAAAHGPPEMPAVKDHRKPCAGAAASAAWNERWRVSYSLISVCACGQCQNT